ncbi:hypothetical protein [Paenibacillus macerans]|uniref:hypothetical protein n=1 Tax=Paenibacillus macerans TaxID=44252 RepID=UPI003D313421
MKNWFVAVLPLLLIVVVPSFDASAPEKASLLQQAAVTKTAAAGLAAVREPETVTVYLNKVHFGPNGATLTGDPIDWYEGKQAAAVFAEREPDSGLDGPPDDYYIVNDEEKQVGYAVAPDAEVLMQIYDRTGRLEDIGVNWNEAVTLQNFSKLFQDTDLIDLSQFPYHLTIEGGQVTRIVQQYVP